jgi:hypothetical protein
MPCEEPRRAAAPQIFAKTHQFRDQLLFGKLGDQDEECRKPTQKNALAKANAERKAVAPK